MDQNIVKFFTRIYSDNRYRIIGKRSIVKDIFRYSYNKMLRPVECYLIKKYYTEKFPLIFIVGVPRSGTTFLSQIIINNFDVAYISNSLAKYWLAPIFGKIVSDRKGNQLNVSYSSFLGNTSGESSPHEFGYFWQYWMNHDRSDLLSERELERIDWKAIRDQLYGLTGVFGKPLLVKNIVYIDYKIEYLAEKLPHLFFIYIKRQPEYVIQSIYESRIKRYGTPDIWWSVRPGQVDSLKEKDPIDQIVYQVSHADRRIKESLDRLETNRWMKFNYEDIINDPAKAKTKLSRLFTGSVIKKAGDTFDIHNGNRQRLPDDMFQRIRKSVNTNEL